MPTGKHVNKLVQRGFGRRTRRVTESVRWAGDQARSGRREMRQRALWRATSLYTRRSGSWVSYRTGSRSGGLLQSLAPAGTGRALGTVMAGSGGHVLCGGRPAERTEGTRGSERGSRAHRGLELIGRRDRLPLHAVDGGTEGSGLERSTIPSISESLNWPRWLNTIAMCVGLSIASCSAISRAYSLSRCSTIAANRANAAGSGGGGGGGSMMGGGVHVTHVAGLWSGQSLACCFWSPRDSMPHAGQVWVSIPISTARPVTTSRFSLFLEIGATTG